MNNITLRQAIDNFFTAPSNDREQEFKDLVTAIRNEDNREELQNSLMIIPDEFEFLRSLVTTQMFLC